MSVYAVGRKMSNKNLEQQINIKFCVKIGKSASETLVLLKLAYGQYTVKKSRVFDWHRQFKKGQDVQDDPRSGQPKTQWTYANVDRLDSLVCSNTNTRLVPEELNMNREKVQQIITEDFGIRKMSAKKISQILKDDQKQHWLHISSDLLYSAEISVMKRGIFNTIRKQNTTECSGKYKIHLG
jgi:hypothetical protein